MGRVITPTYRLEIKISDRTIYIHPMAWRVSAQYNLPGHGKPTTANIDRWVTAYEDSFQLGKPNAHLGFHAVVSARIIRQKTGEIVATWERSKERADEPMFQVIG